MSWGGILQCVIDVACNPPSLLASIQNAFRRRSVFFQKLKILNLHADIFDHDELKGENNHLLCCPRIPYYCHYLTMHSKAAKASRKAKLCGHFTPFSWSKNILEAIPSRRYVSLVTEGYLGLTNRPPMYGLVNALSFCIVFLSVTKCHRAHTKWSVFKQRRQPIFLSKMHPARGILPLLVLHLLVVISRIAALNSLSSITHCQSSNINKKISCFEQPYQTSAGSVLHKWGKNLWQKSNGLASYEFVH